MKNGNKLWIVISFIIVFAAGVTAGILFENNFLDKKPRRDTERRSPSRAPTLDMLADELGLTPEQQEQLKEIFQNNEDRLKAYRDEIHNHYRTLRTQLKQEMDSVFTAEQKAKLEAMIQKHREERKNRPEEKNRRTRSDTHEQGERR
jgi:Spy/CpxP family protein refolding chaperone